MVMLTADALERAREHFAMLDQVVAPARPESALTHGRRLIDHIDAQAERIAAFEAHVEAQAAHISDLTSAVEQCGRDWNAQRDARLAAEERIAELEAERDYARRDQRASEQAATDANREAAEWKRLYEINTIAKLDEWTRAEQAERRIAALEVRCRALVEAGDEMHGHLIQWASDFEMASTDDSADAILAWEQTR
jgi:chromosome segregation ATPase